MISRSQDIAPGQPDTAKAWYLTAEMVDVVEHGCPNIICAACLPNHVVGRGMFRALRTRYPEANIVAVDYDQAEVNRLPQPHRLCGHRPAVAGARDRQITGSSLRRGPGQCRLGPLRCMLGMPTIPTGGQPSA